MNIALLGYDREGKVSYDYFAAQGHHITICDQNPNTVIPEGAAAVLGDEYLADLDQFDLLVRTPGLPPHVILDKNPTVKAKITSQTNEFFKVCPTRNIIGVTGTKGKGTTSTLIARMLQASGKQVGLAGNIGVPALSLLPELSADSWVVLELSSYQLIDVQASPHIAVCVMIVPEHLNWHADMQEYVTAKSQLFIHQNAEDIAVYFGENKFSQQIAETSSGHKIPYFQSPGAQVIDDQITIDDQAICSVNELKLLGKHNWQNVCAALTAVWQVTQDVDAIRGVLTTFSGLEHRIEFVRAIDEVRYYNDSYAAGLHATIAAIEAVQGNKVMIIGGYDRMIDIDHFAPYVMTHRGEFRSILLIGASAGRVAVSLMAAGFTNYVISDATTMTEVVKRSQRLAKPGDAVVFSPGFASFDMFKNFEDRGLQYKSVVNDL